MVLTFARSSRSCPVLCNFKENIFLARYTVVHLVEMGSPRRINEKGKEEREREEGKAVDS